MINVCTGTFSVGFKWSIFGPRGHVTAVADGACAAFTRSDRSQTSSAEACKKQKSVWKHKQVRLLTVVLYLVQQLLCTMIPTDNSDPRVPTVRMFFFFYQRGFITHNLHNIL